MPDATPNLGIRYLKPSDPPDLSGGLFDLAMSLEQGPLAQGGWAPGYGGDGGATTGNNGGTSGYAARLGKRVSYHGRVLFGSAAVFGGAVVTGVNYAGNCNGGLSHGRGYYRQQGGGRYPVVLVPVTGSEFQVLWARDAGLVGLNQIGTPAQSSELYFHIDAILA